jgi:hypothetical protein
VTGGVHRVRWGSRDHFLIVHLDIAPPEQWSFADVVVVGERTAEEVFRSLPGCVVVLRAADEREWTAWSRDGRRISLRCAGSEVWVAAVAYVLLSRVACGGTSVTASSRARSSTALGSSTWTYLSNAPE